MTKSVKFDENGRRSEIEIQIFELNTQGNVLIGTWDPEEGIKKVLSISPIPVEGDPALQSLRNRTFIVLTALVSFHFVNYTFLCENYKKMNDFEICQILNDF